MKQTKFAFSKSNYILLAIGFLIILIGFAMMMGPSTTELQYEPDIFSARRIKLAPALTLLGFLFMIFAILFTPKNTKE
ncbi:MAG: DUF3098 domain-containing protein [Phocaeicola sp.]|nr:DUF3098 domain-containing protein [Phocaeicola sp.]MDD7448737.1 DUF3098 domain-containing protein [Prevotellaceae bacterium]MDY5938240.1 DUF3098 domain-containing protein [Phocaeicola sp.]